MSTTEASEGGSSNWGHDKDKRPKQSAMKGGREKAAAEAASSASPTTSPDTTSTGLPSPPQSPKLGPSDSSQPTQKSRPVAMVGQNGTHNYYADMAEEGKDYCLETEFGWSRFSVGKSASDYDLRSRRRHEVSSNDDSRSRKRRQEEDLRNSDSEETGLPTPPSSRESSRDRSKDSDSRSSTSAPRSSSRTPSKSEKSSRSTHVPTPKSAGESVLYNPEKNKKRKHPGPKKCKWNKIPSTPSDWYSTDTWKAPDDWQYEKWLSSGPSGSSKTSRASDMETAVRMLADRYDLPPTVAENDRDLLSLVGHAIDDVNTNECTSRIEEWQEMFGSVIHAARMGHVPFTTQPQSSAGGAQDDALYHRVFRNLYRKTDGTPDSRSQILSLRDQFKQHTGGKMNPETFHSILSQDNIKKQLCSNGFTSLDTSEMQDITKPSPTTVTTNVTEQEKQRRIQMLKQTLAKEFDLKECQNEFLSTAQDAIGMFDASASDEEITDYVRDLLAFKSNPNMSDAESYWLERIKKDKAFDRYSSDYAGYAKRLAHQYDELEHSALTKQIVGQSSYDKRTGQRDRGKASTIDWTYKQDIINRYNVTDTDVARRLAETLVTQSDSMQMDHQQRQAFIDNAIAEKAKELGWTLKSNAPTREPFYSRRMGREKNDILKHIRKDTTKFDKSRWVSELSDSTAKDATRSAAYESTIDALEKFNLPPGVSKEWTAASLVDSLTNSQMSRHDAPMEVQKLAQTANWTMTEKELASQADLLKQKRDLYEKHMAQQSSRSSG